MSTNESILLNSDGGLRIGGVTAHADPTTPTAVGAATVTGRLYDRKKVRLLTAETTGSGGSPTVVAVASAEPYIVGEPFELRLDDGSLHETTVASKDEDANTVTMALAVPGGRIAKINTQAKRKLGSDISMSLYGATPAPSVDTWGYIGTVSDTHEGLYIGLRVRCEVTVDDGADRKRVFVFEARVVEG